MVGMDNWVPGNQHRHHHPTPSYGGAAGFGGSSSSTSATGEVLDHHHADAAAVGMRVIGGDGAMSNNHLGSLTTSRSSLGKLIERSTSAPPSSSSYASFTPEGYLKSSDAISSSKPYGGLTLVGGNLLEQLTRNYSADPTLSSSTTSLRDLAPHPEFIYEDGSNMDRNGGGPLDSSGYPLKDTPSNQDLLSLLGTGSTNSGRSTAPLSDASRSHSASGGSLTMGGFLAGVSASASPTIHPHHHQPSSSASRSRGGADAVNTGSDYSSFLGAGGTRNHPELIRSQSASPFPNSMVMLPDGGGLFRSQSAAPSSTSVIGPPPGLGMSSSSSAMGTFRSASAASGLPRIVDVAGNMPHPSRGGTGSGGGGSGMGMGNAGSGAAALRPAAKTPLDLIQEDFPSGSHLHSHSNSFDSSNNDVPTSTSSSRRPSSSTTTSGSPQQQLHKAAASNGSDMMAMGSQPHPQLRSVDYSTPPRSHSVPAERLSPQQQQQLQQQQYQQQHRASPPHLTNLQQVQGSVVVHQQPSQQQPQLHEQAVYYHHQQPQPQQQQMHQAPTMQATHMVHPHGQGPTTTLYVNAQTSQSFPSHGYTTIHYHPAPSSSSSQLPHQQHLQQQPQRISPTQMLPNQMAQIVHHQAMPNIGGGGMGLEQRYVSLVPVQANGGVVHSTQGQAMSTYWQPPHDATMANSSTMDMGVQQQHHLHQYPQTMTVISGGATGQPHHSSAHVMSGGGGGRGGGLQVLPNSAELGSQQYYVADPYSHRQGGHAAGTTTRPQQQHSRDKTSAGERGGQGGRGRRGPSGGGNGSRHGADRRGGNDSKHPTCSLKLEEFRAMKNRDWTMHEIAGYVVEFCQDQNGSRFIQQRLEMGDATEQQVVAKEVLPAIRRLRNDVFGNYVVQKLLDFGSPQVKAEIRDTLEGEMLQLSLQMYGCRVVQKALEALGQDDVSRLLIEFHHNVLSCIHDQNGNHVIQKCIEVVSKRAKKERCVGADDKADHLNRQIKFIIDDVLHNTVSLSCHPYGCRVLQRILEHCDEDRKERVLTEIKKCHRKLLDDQYGNYVIQHVLQYGRVMDRDAILSIVVESGLLRLSRQKFASNVVEKLLKYGNDRHICAIVREMLKPGDDPSRDSTNSATTGAGSTVVLHMVRDAYANYVVQTTLDVVPDPSEERNMLIHELNNHSDELRQYTFAKHIVQKLTALNGGIL